MSDEILDFAKSLLVIINDGPTHYAWCDYLHRNPPRYDDCDCGANVSQEATIVEAAEELAQMIVKESNG